MSDHGAHFIRYFKTSLFKHMDLNLKFLVVIYSQIDTKMNCINALLEELQHYGTPSKKKQVFSFG